MKQIKKVTLEMTERQAETIITALDFLCRVGQGQTNIIREIFEVKFDKKPWFQTKVDNAENLLKEIKKIYFPGLDANLYSYYPVIHKQVSEEAKLAHDILAVMEHKIACFKIPKAPHTAPVKVSLKEEFINAIIE